MPLPDRTTLTVAATFMRAAYDESGVFDFHKDTVSDVLSRLGQSGWTVLSLGGSHVDAVADVRPEVPGTDVRGFFLNGNAAAIAAVKGNELVLSIRGSELGSLPDYRDATFDPTGHYGKLQNFISAAVAWARNHDISKVVVTGHSLGGEMAQLFAAKNGDGLLSAADSVGHPGHPIEDVTVVTFGDPGLPPNVLSEDSTFWAPHIFNFGHTQDLVFNHTGNYSPRIGVQLARESDLNSDEGIVAAVRHGL